MHGLAQPRSALPNVANSLFGDPVSLCDFSRHALPAFDILLDCFNRRISMACSGCRIVLVLHAWILDFCGKSKTAGLAFIVWRFFFCIL